MVARLLFPRLLTISCKPRSAVTLPLIFHGTKFRIKGEGGLGGASIRGGERAVGRSFGRTNSATWIMVSCEPGHCSYSVHNTLFSFREYNAINS